LVFTKYHKGNAISFATDLDEFLNFNIFEDSFRKQYWNVKYNDIVMDVGVDFGPYTLTALSQGARHVYAVEPRTNAITKLVENLELNPRFLNKTTIIKRAVSDVSFDIITIVDSNLSSREREPRFNKYTENEERVYTITVDDIVNKYSINKLDWLKIDVEGMEDKVLLGAEDTLVHLKPRIIIENHGASNERNTHNHLRDLGYELIHKNKEFYQNLFNTNSQSVYHHLFERY
jgi:FkbM family methyltransferase